MVGSSAPAVPSWWTDDFPEKVATRSPFDAISSQQTLYVRYKRCDAASTVPASQGWELGASRRNYEMMVRTDHQRYLPDDHLLFTNQAPESISLTICEAPSEWAVPVKQDRRMSPAFKVRADVRFRNRISFPLTVRASIITQQEKDSILSWVPEEPMLHLDEKARSMTELKGTASVTHHFEANPGNASGPAVTLASFGNQPRLSSHLGSLTADASGMAASSGMFSGMGQAAAQAPGSSASSTHLQNQLSNLSGGLSLSEGTMGYGPGMQLGGNGAVTLGGLHPFQNAIKGPQLNGLNMNVNMSMGATAVPLGMGLAQNPNNGVGNGMSSLGVTTLGLPDLSQLQGFGIKAEPGTPMLLSNMGLSVWNPSQAGGLGAGAGGGALLRGAGAWGGSGLEAGGQLLTLQPPGQGQQQLGGQLLALQQQQQQQQQQQLNGQLFALQQGQQQAQLLALQPQIGQQQQQLGGQQPTLQQQLAAAQQHLQQQQQQQPSGQQQQQQQQAQVQQLALLNTQLQSSQSSNGQLCTLSHEFEFSNLEFLKPTRMNRVYIVFSATILDWDLLYVIFSVPTIGICRAEQREKACLKLGVPMPLVGNEYVSTNAIKQEAMEAAQAAARKRDAPQQLQPESSESDGNLQPMRASDLQGLARHHSVSTPATTGTAGAAAGAASSEGAAAEASAAGGSSRSRLAMHEWLVEEYETTGLTRKLTQLDIQALLSQAGFPTNASSNFATISQVQWDEFQGQFRAVLSLLRQIAGVWNLEDPYVISGFDMDRVGTVQALAREPAGTFICRFSMSQPGCLVLTCKTVAGHPKADPDNLIHAIIKIDDLYERRVDTWIRDFAGATHVLDAYRQKRVDKRKVFASNYTRLRGLETEAPPTSSDIDIEYVV